MYLPLSLNRVLIINNETMIGRVKQMNFFEKILKESDYFEFIGVSLDSSDQAFFADSSAV